MAASQNNRLKYVDGLKGTGALIVYLCHFAYAFYYALYSLDSASSHTANGLEIAIGRTPLNILYNGNFAVELFFAASGFVLCLGYFRDHDRKRLPANIVKRYLRLALPIFIVSSLIFLLMKNGLYMNTEAAVIARSTQWFGGFNNFEPGYSHAVYEALAGCFLFGYNYFNGVLWTVKYLFLGAVLVYVLVFLIGDKKWRYIVYAAALLALCRTDYAGILAGFVISDLVCTKQNLIAKITKLHLPALFCMVLGIYLGSYPSIGTNLEGSIYASLPVMAVMYHRIGAILILWAVATGPLFQKFFAAEVLLDLGEVSFSWYLLHFPVIATFSSWFLLTFYRLTDNYHLLMAVDFILTTLLVRILAGIMTAVIENPWNRLLTKIFAHKAAKTQTPEKAGENAPEEPGREVPEEPGNDVPEEPGQSPESVPAASENVETERKTEDDSQREMD